MSLKVPKSNTGSLQFFNEGYKQAQGLEDAVLGSIQAVSQLFDLVRMGFDPGPQESEMSDATNTALVLAGGLLKRAEGPLVTSLHSSGVIQGYELVLAKALAKLEIYSTKTAHVKTLTSAFRPPIALKRYGFKDTLSSLKPCSRSCPGCYDISKKGFNVDNVRVAKIMGGDLSMSKVVQAIVVAREPGDEMLSFTTGEEKQLEKNAGVKVVIGESSVGELVFHYFNRLNITVIKVLSKFDLRRLQYSNWSEKAQTATIVWQGATAYHLDDLERAAGDGVNFLSKSIEEYGMKSLVQHTVKRYASLLEVVPRTLVGDAFSDEERNEIRHSCDSLAAKSWAIYLATEAAISILNVDSIITSKPAGGLKVLQQAGNRDDDD
ncbi:hypothetical protein AMATHDRAFT_77760 [Amanita thiersii Skay4041]|uniref:Uncharacterized protein n=1 Tax=Amanita thiersii Skay4041 TaxID=703135 RepID=A0A2A9NDB8_9AGAR|nr:hypothetical protein AMATHDRAFT_77760 [Amanita thiersii Skay4041]